MKEHRLRRVSADLAPWRSHASPYIFAMAAMKIERGSFDYNVLGYPFSCNVIAGPTVEPVCYRISSPRGSPVCEMNCRFPAHCPPRTPINTNCVEYPLESTTCGNTISEDPDPVS